MTKKGKKKNTKLDIEFTKSTKILLLIVTILVILLFIVVSLTYISNTFSNIFWFNIKNPINAFLFNIFQYFPFITNNFLIIIIGTIIIIFFCIISLSYLNISNKKRKIILIISNIFNKILALIILLSFISIALTISDFNHQNINRFYLTKYNDTKYDEEDVFSLLRELVTILKEESKLLPRENGDINIKKSVIEKISRKDLLNISKDYEFLKGTYPTKIKEINSKLNVYGYTNNYSISTDKTINNVNYMSVITHEYCHYKGVLHESDAVYCAYLAGINSKEILSNYSAHLEAFSWVMNVSMKIDEKKTNKIVEEILSLCLNDNYREICDLQIKNISEYQNKSNIIKLDTYLLSSYTNHQEEILNILNYYNENYDAIFVIEKGEVTLLDIKKLITSNSDQTLNIYIKNDNNIFNDIKTYLNKTNKYFKSIQQQNTNYDYNDDNIDYYIRPFTSGLSSIFEDEYNNYAYTRVVRLLLEHRSLYGIK